MATSRIVLAALNARHPHAALGLRYLQANMGDLRDGTALLEFEAAQRPLEIVEAILTCRPAIVGLSVHVWNVVSTTQVVSLLKRVRPEVTVVIGGPEVSHGPMDRRIVAESDYLVIGEADHAFPALCREILDGRPPIERALRPSLPDLAEVALPYAFYTDADLAHRVVYVESSRGCPFACEFCLSALDERVRPFPVDRFLQAMGVLLERGARRLKFVDRTFNLDLRHARAILEFFLTRLRPDLHLHFEVVPDRFPEALREVVRRFPPGVLQFEVGVQSFDPAVLDRISRRQDPAKVEDTLRFLRAETGAHIHVDLLAGLHGLRLRPCL